MADEDTHETFTLRSILSDMTLGELLGWDFRAAIATGAVLTILTMLGPSQPPSLAETARDLLQVAGGIFGIVLAAFGIIVAIFGERFAVLVRKSQLSPRDFLSGFLVTAWILASSILTSLSFVLLTAALQDLSPFANEAAFGAVLIMFAWSLFTTLEMLRYAFVVASLSLRLNFPPGDPDAQEDR